MLDNLCWFLSSAFSQFSLIAFMLRSLFFLRFFLVDSSDKIRLLVSFVGRGARLWRHPG